ncbi:Yip [Giardia lamblia P15]|uniref:Yip n=1 Tax=Giardia intestinalis (strain P15) TaxID=658858 RepID=E1F872_GIAIA|nr:Yip [Giardia lamblia P15]
MIPGYVGDDTESGPLVPPIPSNNSSNKKKGVWQLFESKTKKAVGGPQVSPPLQQPSFTMQQPPQVRQTAEQNEMDLYYGSLVQELGIDLRLVGKKLFSTLPFVPVSDEVAQSGDMIIGICVLIVFTFVNFLTKSTGTHLGFLFGVYIYGSLLLTFLLSMLQQTAIHLDLYTVMSALSYGLLPLLIPMIICSFVRQETLEHAQKVVVIGYLGAAVASSLVSTKLLNAAVRLENVKTLIAIPAFLITMCYVLVQISK